jgi:peptidylprolyl isomerase
VAVAAVDGPEWSVPRDVDGPPADAELTASGLASKRLRPGTGTVSPRIHDRVTVHYVGWTTDGQEVDSSIPAPADAAVPPANARSEPTGTRWKSVQAGQGPSPTAQAYARFHFTSWQADGAMVQSSRRKGPLTMPIAKARLGWKEVLVQMNVGQKVLVWAPRPDAGFMLYELELLGFVEPPPAPPDVAAPPVSATVADTVEVHYSGWTTDGKLFDSSIALGRPSRVPLAGVIPGWTEGLQLDVELIAINPAPSP